MLIGFSGPSGSGKTTLVNMVAERLRQKGYDVGVVGEVAREVFESYKDAYGVESLDEIRNSDILLDFQFEILVKQKAKEEAALNVYDIVLADRTIYDNLLYTLLWSTPAKAEGLKAYLRTFNRVDGNGRRYRLIFLCVPVNGPVDDGFRTPDLRYRRVQFEVIKRLLPDYCLLPAFGPDERAELATNIIVRLIK